ncbi:MAG: ABC transporter permease [Candidatus Sungbacteria bacterium]|uniref:Cell division protein FtsX n=1 Tax=Candidatus Sungiibacteriota bacterium TaxID=2750080 RepID=A0A932QYF7_9BACT|nr:ABC transporter permease [Candidatus Sungbacteria bacterium]
MKSITAKRVIRAGYLSFRRNVWLSTATIMVMSLALFVMGGLVFLGAVSSTVLRSLESKIDVTVYFNADAPEQDILAVKQDVESRPDVKEVSYVSRDSALASFRERHKDNALIVGALDELGDNPLQASLNVKAQDSSRYGAISDFLAQKNYPAVSKINYFENQQVITRLSAMVGTVREAGGVLTLFLVFLAVLVAFNTIRMAIYTVREEIAIMRLVGGSPWFIRGPFLVTGLLYGAMAGLLVTLAFFPLTWLVTSKLAVLVPDFNLFKYFVANGVEFFLIMLAAGIALGVVSSLIAVRRYLDV